MTTVSLPSTDLANAVDLPPGVEVIVWDGSGPHPDGADRLEVLIGSAPPPAETLHALPALRVIQVLSAGVEHWVDLVPDGVTLCNARGVPGPATAELAVAGMLTMLRDLPDLQAAQREHRWDPRAADGVIDRRVLVLGAGDIGARIAAALRPLDAEVTLVARHARDGVRTMDELPGLLGDQDVVVLALPDTPETEQLVDADFLTRMRDGALLVNIARGKIVDTGALLAELQASRLRAFLDVVDPEPLPPEHPLWSAPGVLITPHVGGNTTSGPQRIARFVGQQLRRYVDGDVLANIVDDY